MAKDTEPELTGWSLDLPYDLGRYRLEAEIGRGGMGAVYHAVDTMLDRPVAVKVLLPQLAADGSFVERFKREAQMAARLEHPNIVTVHDVGQADGLVYFVMRMVLGKPLDRLIEEGLDWTKGEAIALNIAEALAYAHENGVIHRDIKPENVIVGKDGAVTITDFGLARPDQQAKGPTQAGTILGTPGYMAPEQALGESVDHRVDLYAFGILLFEIATGDLPFDGTTPFAIINQHISTPPPKLTEVKPDAPAWLSDLIDRLLAKKPDDRPRSASQVAEILRENIGSTITRNKAIEATLVEQGLAGGAKELVAKVRRGEMTLSDALHRYPAQSEVLQEAFRREMTVVSLDLAGSTELKQKGGGTIALGPLFNAYRSMVDEVLQANGIVEVVWAGDGTVGLFKLPSQAVKAAQTIVRKLRDINQKFATSPDLGVRIGIHTGSVLRDPNQPLGHVTSSTLDLTGHLQKDAKVGLVEISQTTLDKLPTAENWVPLRKSRDADLMIYAWHPDGPDKVPQSWVNRMRFGSDTSPGTAKPAAEPKRKSGEAKRATKPPPASGKRTKPGEEQFACFYCQAPVTAKDQMCPDCGRLNRHYDPALDPKAVRVSIGPLPSRQKKRDSLVRTSGTLQQKKVAAQRTPTKRPAAAGKTNTPSQEDSMQAMGEMMVGAFMAVAGLLLLGYLGRGQAWYQAVGSDGYYHTRTTVVVAPALALIGLGYSQRNTSPAIAFGMFIGSILGLALLYALKWWY